MIKTKSMNEPFAIAIHGGAGTLDKKKLTSTLYNQYEQALNDALQAGWHILQKGGHSLDAVEKAVMELEDCPFFNAGRGSVFNNVGKHEMDAAIMDGRSLKAGAVAGIIQIKNPIQVARAVMDKSPFVFLCGQGANDFAQVQGITTETDDYFYNELRYKEWQQELENEATPQKFGTVGAVALDKQGNLAAATSTGGITNKKFGRVGDSPVIGGGTYANNNTCAVSCTGEGEQFIRTVAAYDVSCLIEYKQLSLHDACAHTMQKLQTIQGSGGLIAVDKLGNIEMPFNTEGMYRACIYTNGTTEIRIFE
jgi:beta-aspartyl-peptidase (threonine type)